jgi:hypothetical protein
MPGDLISDACGGHVPGCAVYTILIIHITYVCLSLLQMHKLSTVQRFLLRL